MLFLLLLPGLGTKGGNWDRACEKLGQIVDRDVDVSTKYGAGKKRQDWHLVLHHRLM